MPTKSCSKKAKKPAGPKKDSPPTKAETLAALAEQSGLPKSDVSKVLDALESSIESSLAKYKQFTFNGLFKIVVKHVDSKPAHEGRKPGTGEVITVKAKPAHNVVRFRALKRIKDMAV